MRNRVLLIHWKPEEARERAAFLSRAGYEVECFSTAGGGEGLRAYRERPPDAFVIDLSRLPSQGRAVATFLRQQKTTRMTPLVFVGGDPEKAGRIRRALPDATYVEWRAVRGGLREAFARRPAAPVVPGTMDAYSGRPLAKKLGIRARSVVALLGAPEGFARKLEGLPEGVRVQSTTRGPAATILLFVKSVAELDWRFAAAVRALAEGGGLWICWPKQASGVSSDLTQAAVRAYGLARGLVDYKICAVDQTWSGLLFARRSV